MRLKMQIFRHKCVNNYFWVVLQHSGNSTRLITLLGLSQPQIEETCQNIFTPWTMLFYSIVQEITSRKPSISWGKALITALTIPPAAFSPNPYWIPNPMLTLCSQTLLTFPFYLQFHFHPKCNLSSHPRPPTRTTPATPCLKSWLQPILFADQFHSW